MLINEWARASRGRQALLARELAVTPQTVNKWVAGEVMPDQERWPDLERVMGLEAGTIAAARDVTPPGAADDILLIQLGLQVARMDDAMWRLEDRVRVLEQSADPPNARPAPPTDLTSRAARAGKRGA